MVADEPTASNATSNSPLPASSDGSTAAVAPNVMASSHLTATGSTATTDAAPAARAACTTDRPTPPHPITTTVSPARTPAVLRTAPTPVLTPQLMSAPTSNGTSSGRATRLYLVTTPSSANTPQPACAGVGCPSTTNRGRR